MYLVMMMLVFRHIRTIPNPKRKSAKQSTTAMSSTEAECMATAKASMEAVWMRKFIDGLGSVMPSNKRPMGCYVT
ncbi:hypothetical protein Tco_0607511, partial [Tanacetum coccineum]